MADVDRLVTRFRIASTDQRRRSPFNARLLAGIADRPDIAALLQAAPDEQQLPVLLLAAVHSMVLAEPGVALAAWYPTVSERPRVDDPFPAFARFVTEREAEIRAIVGTRSTQTNEVGRCALFLPALARVEREAGRLGLVDIGTSAGLNLRLDRYAYDFDGRRVGGRSPVVLPCGVRGDIELPARIPTIGGRVGIDRSPVDLADDDQVRWLMACVWPDQHDRFERLRAAVGIAREHPVEVLVGEAHAALGPALTRLAPDEHPVVITSWVLNYLNDEERSAFVADLDRVGAERDLSWIALESPGLCRGVPFPSDVADSFLTHLLLVRWRGGGKTVAHLAECHPHGYWMHAPG
jgi:hypothetical protein